MPCRRTRTRPANCFWTANTSLSRRALIHVSSGAGQEHRGTLFQRVEERLRLPFLRAYRFFDHGRGRTGRATVGSVHQEGNSTGSSPRPSGRVKFGPENTDRNQHFLRRCATVVAVLFRAVTKVF